MIKRIENMGSHLLSDCQNTEEGMRVNVSPHIYPVPAYEIIASCCFDSTQHDWLHNNVDPIINVNPNVHVNVHLGA